MNKTTIYNPFLFIAGYKSLAIGLAGLLLTSYLAFITGTHFNGFLNIDLAKDSPFWVYLVENVSHWLILSGVLFGLGIFFSKSRIRAIDVLGTTLFARLPFIFAPLLRTIPYFQSFVYKSVAMYLIIAIYIVSLIWALLLLYNAYKVSCNLKNEKLTISFIAGICISEAFTKTILYLTI